MKEETISKIQSIVRVLEKRDGPILLFALFLREEPLENWDVIVSSSWLSSGNMQAYEMLGGVFQKSLSPDELVQFSRLVILDETDPVVAFLQDKCKITNGHIETLSGNEFSDKFGFKIKSVRVFRCQTKQDIASKKS